MEWFDKLFNKNKNGVAEQKIVAQPIVINASSETSLARCKARLDRLLALPKSAHTPEIEAEIEARVEALARVRKAMS